ncbi:MAG: hypothetical protein WKF68_04645 [Daejeonella sp.]
MDLVKSLIAGFAGAAALNILHETIRKFDPEAPRLDLLGEDAVKKSIRALDLPALTGDKLYEVTLAGDILSNTTYFSAIGMGEKKFLILKALGSGLSAGIAALKLPETMGLNEKPAAGTNKRKIMTVGYYVFGALVTAGILQMIGKEADE